MHDDRFNRIMIHHQPADDRTFVRTAAGKVRRCRLTLSIPR
jgi:hypothetical protein